MRSQARRRLSKIAAGTLAAAVLGMVFMLYTRPKFMVAMIDQLWACF